MTLKPLFYFYTKIPALCLVTNTAGFIVPDLWVRFPPLLSCFFLSTYLLFKAENVVPFVSTNIITDTEHHKSSFTDVLRATK